MMTAWIQQVVNALVLSVFGYCPAGFTMLGGVCT